MIIYKLCVFYVRKTGEFGRFYVWHAYIPQPFTVSCSHYLGLKQVMLEKTL